MIYYAQSGETALKIDLFDAENATRARFDDGTEVQTDFGEVAPGLYSLIADNASYEVDITPVPDERDSYRVTLGGRTYTVKVETERAHRIATMARGATHQSGALTIKAPMPGLVSQVFVSEGQSVEAGQRVAILEAMKMENEIRAPRAGTIKSVGVAPGQTVELNRVLFSLE